MTERDDGKADHAHPTAHIVQSLAGNVVIAIIKAIAAFFTGSGSMLAEALHSSADCLNQILLLIGVKQAGRPPDASHPLGYGRAVYFWSFLVAVMLFAGGGVFSIYEGLHKIHHPERVEHVGWGIGILLVSLVIEGWACASNVRDLNARRGDTPFLRSLRDTKDADLIVVFGENSAAVLGLVLALVALATASATGDGRWDGAGSVAIGVVLVGVATFLAREVSSLLLGESADPDIERTARALVADMKSLDRVLHMLTVQQGPGEVLVAIKVSFDEELPIEKVCTTINDFEARLRQEHPDVRWCFVEPDLDRERGRATT